MRLITFIFAASLSAQTLTSTNWPADWNQQQHVSRNVSITGHFYVVEYTYNGSYASVPLTNPPGKSHYAATISVYEIVNGTKILIDRTFSGTYVDGGCFEDVVGDEIQLALKAANRLTPDITKAFEEQANKEAFDKMPLYEVNGDQIRITARGLRDLESVMIGDKVVWQNPNPRPLELKP
jgi:hypothetical protein